MEKKYENIVFFEKINSIFYPIVKKYLKKNFIVYFFEIEDKYKENLHIKNFINEKKIINASDLIFDFSLYRIAGFYAHKNIDYFFNKHYSKTQSIKLMQKLLNFPKIIDMYKKEVAIQLENSYYLELKINNIIKNHNSNICFKF